MAVIVYEYLVTYILLEEIESCTFSSYPILPKNRKLEKKCVTDLRRNIDQTRDKIIG